MVRAAAHAHRRRPGCRRRLELGTQADSTGPARALLLPVYGAVVPAHRGSNPGRTPVAPLALGVVPRGHGCIAEPDLGDGLAPREVVPVVPHPARHRLPAADRHDSAVAAAAARSAAGTVWRDQRAAGRPNPGACPGPAD